MLPNFLAVAFGLAGLGEVWDVARPVLSLPRAVPDLFLGASVLVWAVLVSVYVAQGWRRVLADVRDPVLGPFTSLAVITPMIPAVALAQADLTCGRVVVGAFAVATVLLGGFLTGQWIVGDLDEAKAHPGYFLPTVAGGLVASGSLAEVQLRDAAEATFGIGVLCWLLLGSLILNRLFFTKALPTPLVPTLAIELAPPAVAGLSWFVINGGTVDVVARVLGGYAVLMALVQLRFIPLYRSLRFSPGFWAFTFSYAAAVSDALIWIRVSAVPGGAALTVILLVLITGFIGVIAIRTVRLAQRGQLLPTPPAPPAAAAASAEPLAPADGSDEGRAGRVKAGQKP
jgi:tellurite resistance protein